MVDVTTWLTEANPRALLEFLHDRSLLSRRKDRLIACACCRQAWPFLIAMKRRGATHPFFVMWVDNAELLSKR